MKRTYLTLFLSLTVFCGMAQKKMPIHYYKIDIQFKTTDGCERNVTNYHLGNNGTTNFESVKHFIKKWIKPYRMVDNTFFIYGMKRTTKADVNAHKNEKYKPCEDLHFNWDSSGTTATSSIGCDTCHLIFISQPTNVSYSTLLARDLNKTWLNVSAPDSTRTYTVTFSKDVHFVNDTTFTFKLKQ